MPSFGAGLLPKNAKMETACYCKAIVYRRFTAPDSSMLLKRSRKEGPSVSICAIFGIGHPKRRRLGASTRQLDPSSVPEGHGGHGVRGSTTAERQLRPGSSWQGRLGAPSRRLAKRHGQRLRPRKLHQKGPGQKLALADDQAPMPHIDRMPDLKARREAPRPETRSERGIRP